MRTAQIKPRDEHQAFEQTVATTKAAIDEVSFEEEWAKGSLFTLDEAIDDALSEAGT